MWKYLIILGVIIIYKAILNILRIIQCNRYMNDYIEWLNSKAVTLLQNKHEIVKLWKSAGLVDRFAPRTEPMGLGQIVNYKKSVFNSFPDNEEDMAYATMSFFNEAIGIFKNRLKKTLIPFYWIEGIIFLPKIIIEYFGSKNDTIIKFFQGLYWIAGIIFTFVIAVYPDELKKLIDKIIK